MTPLEVQKLIIDYSQGNGVSLLDATVAIADKLEIDLEDMARHVHGSLKEMMQVECEDDGLLKRDSNPSFLFT